MKVLLNSKDFKNKMWTDVQTDESYKQTNRTNRRTNRQTGWIKIDWMEFENFVPSKLEYGVWFTKIETEIANAKCYSKNCFLCRFYSCQKLC